MVRVARRLERRSERLDVDLLVLALVVLRVVGVGELAGGLVPVFFNKFLVSSCLLRGRREKGAGVRFVPGVPAGDVGGDTADLAGAAGVLVDLGELLGAGVEVVVPAEPAAVAGVDVHDDVGQVEGLEGVGDTLLVAGLGLLAGREVGVGHQVGERVGLDDEREGRVGVGLEEVGDDYRSFLPRVSFCTYLCIHAYVCTENSIEGRTFGLLHILRTIDVFGLVPVDLANRQFTVGGLGGAVTARKVVDDETQDVLAGQVSDGVVELADVLDRVASYGLAACSVVTSRGKGQSIKLTARGSYRHQQP